ncbi:hypothetical protein Leryth_011485 [Lithospermum erythrorhizon]|nr:hypothetical protein Leryth_011485 [Lithospermum erythrorhizon]
MSCSKMASSKRLPMTMLEPILALWINFSQRACKASKKIASGSPKRLANKPRQLLSTISRKTFNLRHKKKSTCNDHDEDSEFGDDGLWQRSILMGDKCQPLDFSGVIYYDNQGNQLSEVPMRSPARPLANHGVNKKEE